MRKFQIGDRVRLIKAISHLWTSCLATIRIYWDDNSIIGLEFDEDVGGHTLDGSVKIGRGLWVVADDIELVARPSAQAAPAAPAAATVDAIAEWHDTPSAPIATQIDAINEEYGPAPTCRKLVRTCQGYGYELARFGDYVWVDTGKTAPITLRADKLAA